MIVIRKMEPSEASEVKKIAPKAFTGIERFFVGNPKEAMVAVADNRIVGGVTLKYLTSGGHKIGYYDGAFIDPQYQGEGIGEMLYKKTAEYLWEQGCTALSAIVKDDNVASWKLLINNDFHQISIREGIRLLGPKPMLLQYFSAPFAICNGMELYMAAQRGGVRPKQSHSIAQIGLYFLINILLLLFSFFEHRSNFFVFVSAFAILLLGGAAFGYLGSLFSKRQWFFRLNSGGAVITALISALGGLYPMIGTWYPGKYENTTKFRKDMGLVAAFEWSFILCMTIAAMLLRESLDFWNSFASIGSIFLLYRMIPLYPFESYGGARVFRWSKGLYTILAATSACILLL